MSRRVLIWYWGRLGGGPLVTERLVRHLVARGFDGPLTLSLSSQNERADPTDLPGVTLHRADTFSARPGVSGLLKRIPRFRRQFREILRQARPDVIVIPMMFGALAPLLDIAMEGGREIVYVVHDIVRHPGDTHGLGQTLSQSLILRRAHHLIAMSDTVGDEIKRLAPRVAHKVRTEALAGLFPPLAAPRMAPFRPMRFLMSGRAVQYKGYERLAGALALLPGDGFEVTISGDGPHANKVARLFQDDPRVTLSLSWASPARHAELFRSHDVVLCPYDEASQSAVVCEALAAALPCVVTPVGALAEQIGHGRCGVVASGMTPDAFARAMRETLSETYDYRTASANAVDSLRASEAALRWVELLR
jgi:glycosyltransferase involved in cell wall biosynthesis